MHEPVHSELVVLIEVPFVQAHHAASGVCHWQILFDSHFVHLPHTAPFFCNSSFAKKNKIFFIEKALQKIECWKKSERNLFSNYYKVVKRMMMKKQNL